MNYGSCFAPDAHVESKRTTMTQTLTEIPLSPPSVETSTSTCSGLATTSQVSPQWGGGMGWGLGILGTLTLRGLLSARWFVIRSSIQRKGSDDSLTHKLGPTQIIFWFLHGRNVLGLFLYRHCGIWKGQNLCLHLVFKVLHSFLQSCPHADTMPRNSCCLCYVKVRRPQKIRFYGKPIYTPR